jgi:DNA-directed RNA polymerase subunit N (RpoN/RPB10)
MQLESNEIEQIVEMLKHADGEDLQDILNQLGMEEQLCKQLMMTQPLYIVYDMHQERLELEMQFENTKGNS